MSRNAMLLLPLNEVLRDEIAGALKHLLHLYTVGSFLIAWRNPHERRVIERLFACPEQAYHAAATCAAWVGVMDAPPTSVVPAWWRLPST